MMPVGGYDLGYKMCPCFWGKKPGSLVSAYLEANPNQRGVVAVDAGCGEGKNAHAFANRGAAVTAIDCSAYALENARATWPTSRINWTMGDIATITLPRDHFDVVIAYGLFHCLPDEDAIRSVVRKLHFATKRDGIHIVCCFNNRHQELESAHRGFKPTLLPHDAVLSLYTGWAVQSETDSDLCETHPHNGVPHIHSLTRFIARKNG